MLSSRWSTSTQYTVNTKVMIGVMYYWYSLFTKITRSLKTKCSRKVLYVYISSNICRKERGLMLEVKLAAGVQRRSGRLTDIDIFIHLHIFIHQHFERMISIFLGAFIYSAINQMQKLNNICMWIHGYQKYHIRSQLARVNEFEMNHWCMAWASWFYAKIIYLEYVIYNVQRLF